MSNFKRFVSSVATAAILASGIGINSHAALSTDVIGTDYEEAAKVLSAFEVMVGDGGTGLFRPNDPITRSEVTKIAVALKGLNGAAASSTQTKYPDVRENHWAKGYINVGTSEKLVVGDDLGNFRPDDLISYAEAVTILVRAVGYEPQAQSKGGYPTGYLVAGNSTGLTSGVNVAAARSGNTITRGEVAKLAYNSLNINLMEQTGFGSNEKYEVTDETLLTSKHDAELITGKVTAVGSSALEGEGVGKDEIMINNKIYSIGNADIRNVLGLNVDAYISTASKTKDTVIAIVPGENKNAITTIKADDLDSVTESLITYVSGNKKLKIQIPSGSYVVYNGMATDMDDLKMIESGYITIVENDKNKKIVFINETENYVVDEVIASSGKVIDKYGKAPLVLDEEDDDTTFIIEKDSKVIKPTELNEWDVLTVTQSKNKSLVYGTVTNSTVEGNVEEKDSDTVTISGKEYKIAANYPNEIKLRDEGIFYLDNEGKIAAFKEANTVSKDYAYLVNIGTTSGLSSELKLEVLNASGKLTTLKAASKIKVDGKTYSTPSEALKAIGAKGQLITFKTNSNEEITEIKRSIESEDINENKFTLNFAENNVKYSSKNSKLLANAMKVTIDANTVVFDIPATSKDADDYSVTDKSFFADGDNYDIVVYDVSEDLVAGAVVVTSSENKASEESSVVVVDRLSSTKDEDGNTVVKLYGFQNGEKVSFVSDNDIFVKGPSKLESGDIIQIKADSKGNAKAITLLFDSDKSENEFTTEMSENLTIEYGKVTKKFSNSFNLQVNDGSENNYSAGNAKIYIVDNSKSSNKITIGDASDIQKYDESNPERVFVRIYKDEVVDIVIVKQ